MNNNGTEKSSVTFTQELTDEGLTSRVNLPSETGVPGLNITYGKLPDDPLSLLRGNNKNNYFREMQLNDALIGGFDNMVDSITSDIRSKIEPANDTEEAIAGAKFIEEVFNDMEQPLSAHIKNAMSMRTFGFSLSEMVFKRRLGQSESKRKNSKYNDGLIGIRKLAPRAQVTIDRWNMDDYDIKSITQLDPNNCHRIDIPYSKLLHHKVRSYNENPEGTSLYRNCFKSYYIKKNIMDKEVIRYERGFDGVFFIKAPVNMLDANSKSDSIKAFISWAESTVKNVKLGQDSGIVFPNMPGMEMGILSNSSPTLPDADTIIERANRDMSIALLSDFFLVGQKQNASGSFAASKIKVFSAFVEMMMDEVADQINTVLIPLLWKYNGFKQELMPKFIYDLTELDLTSIMLYLQSSGKTGLYVNTHERENSVAETVFGRTFPKSTEEQFEEHKLLQEVNSNYNVISSGDAETDTPHPITDVYEDAVDTAKEVDNIK